MQSLGIRLIDTELGIHTTDCIYFGLYFIRDIKQITSYYWRDYPGKWDKETIEWLQTSVDINNPQTEEERKIIAEIMKDRQEEIIVCDSIKATLEFHTCKVKEAIEIVKTQSPYQKWNGHRLLLPEGFWNSHVRWYENKPVYYYWKDKTV